MRKFLTLLLLLLCSANAALPTYGQIQQRTKEFQTFLSVFPQGSNLPPFHAPSAYGQDWENSPFLPFANPGGQYCWLPLGRWDYGKVILLLAVRDFNIPKVEAYPYGEVWLLTYSSKGELIDHAVIAKNGDLYAYRLQGTMKPLPHLEIWRGTISEKSIASNVSSLPCYVNIASLEMNAKGILSEAFLRNAPGTMSFVNGKAVLKLDPQ